MEIWTNCNPEAWNALDYIEDGEFERYFEKLVSCNVNTAYLAVQKWLSSGKAEISIKIGGADVRLRRQDGQIVLHMSMGNRFVEYHRKGYSLPYDEWLIRTVTGLFVLDALSNSNPITVNGLLEYNQEYAAKTSAHWNELDQHGRDRVLKMTHVVSDGNQIISIWFYRSGNALRMEKKEHPGAGLKEVLAAYHSKNIEPTVWLCG